MSQEVYVAEGKYILGKRLGGGSFGDIYLGINRHTNDFVAIKIVSSSNINLRNHGRHVSICN